MSRPLIPAGVAFLAGALIGKPALLLFAAAAALAVLARRGIGILGPALFGIAGALTLLTSAELRSGFAGPGPEDASRRRAASEASGDGRSGFAGPGPEDLDDMIIEGDLIDADGERAFIELTGAAVVGATLAPARGRLIGFGDAAPCTPGDRARFLARVRTVHPFGFPGERAEPPRSVARIERCLPLESGWIPLRGPIESLRVRMRRAIDRALPPERAAVVRAMAIGDPIARQPALRRDFADSGLAHILAVSGQHLTIVAALFTVLLASIVARIGPIRDRHGTRRPAALGALALVFGYTLLVGAPASAVRSAVMVAVMLLGELIDRRRETWSALALAVVVMVALEPPVLGSLSFQLSFAAVAGLLALDRPLSRRLRLEAWPRGARSAARVVVTSVAATVGTAPLLAHQFGRISLIGLVANVPAAPLVSLFLLPVSLVGGLAGAALEPLGRPLLITAGWGAEALIWLAQRSAALPGATLAASTLETLLAGAALLAASIFERRAAAGVLAVALAIVAAHARWPEHPTGELVLTALPVGQGTAVLLETPKGARILVDTGPPDTADRVLLPYLLARRIDRLDLVVLSHPHADHTGGFEPLARRVAVDRVWINGDPRDAAPALSAYRGEVVTATAVEIGGARLEILHAERDALRVNDGSIVLRIGVGTRRFLLAGDAERAAELRLLSSTTDLGADVLVLGHHGSATSSSEAFVAAVDPCVAIIPVGRDNRFHHPNARVVARLAARGVRVLRTDLDGAITARTDGVRLDVRSFWGGDLVPAPECWLPRAGP